MGISLRAWQNKIMTKFQCTPQNTSIFGDCLYTKVKIKVKHPESEAIKKSVSISASVHIHKA